MPKITTITDMFGSEHFPVNENQFYNSVEKIAKQTIRAVRNSNVIEDACFNYDISNGKVIEEDIIKMVESQATDLTQADLSPKDAEIACKYFNNFSQRSFKTTTRDEEIESIIASQSVEQANNVVSAIVQTLTEGEGFEDYKYIRDIIFNAQVGTDVKASLFNNKVAKNMKGVAYCMREMYNALKATNNLGGVEFKQATPTDDIRIAVSEKVLNLMDVTELANLFNLEKEKLFGKLVVVPYDAEIQNPNKILVYDRKCIGRATKYYKYEFEQIKSALYNNHWLHVSRAYFFNSLFKAITIDVSQAVNNSLDTILENETNNLTQSTKSTTK